MTRTGLKNKELKQEKELREKELAQREDIARKDRWVGFAGNIVKGLIPSVKFTKSLDSKVSGGHSSKYQTPKRNDASWYKRYVQDLDKFTNLPTFFKHGITDGTFNINNKVNMSTGDFTEGKLPGVFVLNYYPMIGRAWTGNGYASLSQTPFNNILMRTKEQVLKSNSRSSVQYEAADLGYNFIACAGVIQLICEAERALYVAQTYHATNNFFASRLLTALGWHAGNILNDLPGFRQKIILAKHRFNSALVCPQDLTYYQRVMYVNGNLFADHDSGNAMSQIYAYVPRGYYRLSDDTTTVDFIGEGSSNVTDVRYSAGSWYNAVNEAITKICENPDYQDMFADLRSAFGDRLFQLATAVDSDGIIDLNSDETNRLQIHNILTVPFIYNDDAAPIEFINDYAMLTINQDSNGYIFQGDASTGLQYPWWDVELTTASIAKQCSKVINNYKDHILYDTSKTEVTGDDVIEFTRGKLSYTTEDVAASSVRLKLNCVGTELVESFSIFDRGSHYDSASLTVFADGAVQPMNAEELGYMAYASTFDWAPLHTLAYKIDGTYFNQFSYGDLYHPFQVDMKTCMNIMDVCTQSLFYIDSNQFKR